MRIIPFLHRRFSGLLALFGLALIAAAMPARAENGAPAADMGAWIDALMERSFEEDGPGAVVVVAKDGEVIHRSVRGMADIEAGEAITPSTVFRFASITKQFAAATALKLAEQGKLSLDDPLSKFLPDYPAPGNAVTVRQLLNHTSGIRSYTGIPGWMVEANTAKAFTTAEMIAEFQDQPVDFPAGNAFAYNNSGYYLLGAVIEQVTGKPWYEAMADELTGPMGASTISAFMNEAGIANMAKGYTPSADGNVLAQKIHASVPGAAGALRGTADDLIIWTHALHSGGVVNDDLFAQMIAPTQLPDGEIENYGFGLVITDVRERPAIGHAGGIFGFVTDVLHVQGDGVTVAMLANSDETSVPISMLTRKIAAYAIGDPFTQFTAIKPDMETLKPLFGRYAISDTENRQFYERDGQLYTLRSGSAESEVFAAEGGKFFYGESSLSWFDFSEGEDGAPVMQMRPNGAREIERAAYAGAIEVIEPIDVPVEVLATYAGTYVTDYGIAVFGVSDEDQLTLVFAGQPETELVATSENVFTVEGIDVNISFAPDPGAGDVMTMTLVQGGVTLKAPRSAD
ncbi:MAG: serine hydrolase domain-containing protein [Pseudomonadota bacterium]